MFLYIRKTLSAWTYEVYKVYEVSPYERRRVNIVLSFRHFLYNIKPFYCLFWVLAM